MAENQAQLAMMTAKDKETKQKDYMNMKKVQVESLSRELL